jgi:hypothetical protein
LAYPKQWVDISSILLSILVRSNVTINSIIMINVIDAIKAKLNLDVINETIECDYYFDYYSLIFKM